VLKIARQFARKIKTQAVHKKEGLQKFIWELKINKI